MRKKNVKKIDVSKSNERKKIEQKTNKQTENGLTCINPTTKNQIKSNRC